MSLESRNLAGESPEQLHFQVTDSSIGIPLPIQQRRIFASPSPKLTPPPRHNLAGTG